MSFSSSNREVYAEKDSNKILYRNYTRLFRDDINWDKLVKHIIKDDKSKKIYCYACSDGSEPYSLAIALILKLGYKNAKKYFPIIAKDNDSYIIDKAKSGYINVTADDKLRLISLNFPVKEFFKKTNDTSGNSQTIYKVNDILRNCVNFNMGNLISDSTSLDFDNSILMFRNVWPYFDEKTQIQLIKTLSKKFNRTSSLVIGDFDYSIANLKANYYNGEVTTFNERLNNNGLYLVKPLIYEKLSIKNPINLLKVIYAHITQQAQFTYNHIMRSGSVNT